MMNLYIMFIQEKVYTITTEMTFNISAGEDPPDVDALTEGLAAIIADTLGVDKSDVSLTFKNKTNSEKAEKPSLAFLLTVTTNDRDVVDRMKNTKDFIQKVNVKIEKSENDAVKGVKLHSLSEIECEGCGK